MIVCLFILPACGDIGSDSTPNETATPDKGALYGEAVKKLAGDESVNITRLDRRFTALDQQLSGFIDGDEEMDIAQFTRIKIAMDYLEGEGYNQEKIRRLQMMFKEAYAEIESDIRVIDGSLADRYNELNRTLQRVTAGDDSLTVARYLQLERGINDLETDGYMISSRISSLRSGLLQAVLYELEAALIDFEVPEEIVELEPAKVESSDGSSAVEESAEENVSENITAQPVVRLVDGGLDREKLTVNVGQTVVFENDRRGRYKLALLVGNRECRDLKSGFFNTGQSYNWTFTKEQTCWVSDGIFTTEAVKIVVRRQI